MSYIEILSKKKVAVIGLGYVGLQLVNFLKKIQDEIDFEIFEINRSNINLITTEVFDYVFNCAGNTGNFRQQVIKTVESNVGLNLYLLENCQINEALVALSSTRIYGFTTNENEVFSEDSFNSDNHLSLDAIYDNSKKLMECLLINTPRNYRKIVIRLSNVFGNYRLEDLDDSTFLKLMLRYKYENKLLEVKQNINSSKDYIFIEDALEGILRGGVLSETDSVFNICSGESYSIVEWADFLNLPVKQVTDQSASYSSVSNKKSREVLDFVTHKSLKNLELTDIIKYE